MARSGTTGIATRHPAASQGHPATSQERTFQVPAALRTHLATWGPQLRRKMETVAKRRGLTLPRTPVHVGTDCSGCDAPIIALRAVQLPYGFRHQFSSEVDAKKRSFLKANFPGVVVHHDMLKRDHAQLPHIDMYVCGFPCKPFSRLHVRSKGFREKQARPFRVVIQTLSAKLPVIAVLENVSGLRTHMAKVHRALASIRWYEILTMTIDPYEMGEPVRRQRIYFVLIRVDVAVAYGIKLDEHAQALTAVGLCSQGTEPARRMLPNDSPRSAST